MICGRLCTRFLRFGFFKGFGDKRGVAGFMSASDHFNREEKRERVEQRVERLMQCLCDAFVLWFIVSIVISVIIDDAVFCVRKSVPYVNSKK